MTGSSSKPDDQAELTFIVRDRTGVFVKFEPAKNLDEVIATMDRQRLSVLGIVRGVISDGQIQAIQALDILKLPEDELRARVMKILNP